MSLVVNVSYHQLTKKVTVNRSKTVADLVQASLDKFGLENKQGVLLDPKSNKPLDNGNPIRFSNIINNGKLSLEVKTIEMKMVSLKVMKPDGSSQVVKVNNHSKVSDLIEVLALPMEDLLMSLMNKVLVVQEHSDSQLKDLIGDVANLVIRLSIKRDIEQPRGILAPRAPLEPTPEPPVEPTPPTPQAPEPKKEKPEPKKDIPDPEPATKASEVSSTPQVSIPQVSNTPVPESTEIEESEVDVMYKPSKTEIYENPEEDYELTLNQAKIYQNMIKYNPHKRPASKPKEPEVYQLRIKFPNNHILAIKLNRGEKFGELIKRIDSHLTDNFKSNYQLKLSYPPFKSLTIGFMTNSKPLSDLEDVHDKTLLIWNSELKGQYLIDEISKDYNEMPQVKLENMRDELPDEKPEPVVNTSTSSDSRRSNGKSNGDKKVPKWLKIGK